MNEEKAKITALKLMCESESALLATINEKGFPEIRAMVNLRNFKNYPKLKSFFKKHENDFLVYCSTNTSSRKVKQIKENSKVSIYYHKPGEWTGVSFSGNVEIVTNIEEKKILWQPEMTMYYPKGVTDPENTILKIIPNSARLYFQLDFCNFLINS